MVLWFLFQKALSASVKKIMKLIEKIVLNLVVINESPTVFTTPAGAQSTGKTEIDKVTGRGEHTCILSKTNMHYIMMII